MKKFKFNLESLLTVRSWEEQRARQILSEANFAVAELSSRVDAIGEEKDKAFAAWLPASGVRYTAAQRWQLEAQMAGLARDAGRLEKELQEARRRQETAMVGVVGAMRQKRVVELLKERRQREHAVEHERQEAAEIEDIFNARRSAPQ